MALLQLLRKYQGDAEVDKLREGLRFLVEALMDLEVTERIGAARYGRTPTRQRQRNGYRLRPWDTRVGRPSRPVKTAVWSTRRRWWPSGSGRPVSARCSGSTL